MAVCTLMLNISLEWRCFQGEASPGGETCRCCSQQLLTRNTLAIDEQYVVENLLDLPGVERCPQGLRTINALVIECEHRCCGMQEREF